MTEHTKEPWTASKSVKPDNTGGYDFAITDTDKNIIAEVFEHVDYGTDTKYLRFPVKATARRIVACVNACAGIGIESLEAGGIADMMLNIARLERTITDLTSLLIKPKDTPNA